MSYWDKYVAESARGHGLSPFYWSTPSNPFDWTSGAVTDAQRVSVLTGGAAPPPPNGAPYAASGLTATGGTSQIILSWTAGSGATSYNLYRSTASGLESSNAAPVITGITGTSYTNTGLNSGITYYYQVVATNSSGASGFSAEAHATTSGTTDSAQFNFESSSQGWTGGGGIVSGVATSTAQHYAGNQSLAVNFNGSSSGTASPSVGNVAVVPGTTITFHVWIPSGSQVSALQPYIQDHNYTWSSSWYGSFTANAWNTLTLTVPTNAVSPLQSLGVQFITSAGWTGTCYIDSVSLTTPAPDFNLSANPTSLTVNGGTNGTSTITVTAMNGLNACYTLSASNLPSGSHRHVCHKSNHRWREHADAHGLQHRNLRHVERDRHRHRRIDQPHDDHRPHAECCHAAQHAADAGAHCQSDRERRPDRRLYRQRHGHRPAAADADLRLLSRRDQRHA